MFGPLPRQPTTDALDRVAANVGKALEAFERQLRPEPTRLDRYLRQLQDGDSGTPVLSAAERAGLRLFIGRGNCLRCHQGPLLSNHGFHNTGLPGSFEGQPDSGRATGLPRALADPYNCSGAYSDAAPSACPHLEFARPHAPELLGAFKVPSLRAVGATAPTCTTGASTRYNRSSTITRQQRTPTATTGIRNCSRCA